MKKKESKKKNIGIVLGFAILLLNLITRIMSYYDFSNFFIILSIIFFYTSYKIQKESSNQLFKGVVLSLYLMPYFIIYLPLIIIPLYLLSIPGMIILSSINLIQFNESPVLFRILSSVIGVLLLNFLLLITMPRSIEKIYKNIFNYLKEPISDMYKKNTG